MSGWAYQLIPPPALISKNIQRINSSYYHSMDFYQFTNLFPMECKVCFEFFSPMLLQFKINNFGRYFGLDHPMEIVGITGEDNQIIFKGMILNCFIRKSIAPIVRKRKIGSIKPGKFTREVRINQKPHLSHLFI